MEFKTKGVFSLENQFLFEEFIVIAGEVQLFRIPPMSVAMVPVIYNGDFKQARFFGKQMEKILQETHTHKQDTRGMKYKIDGCLSGENLSNLDIWEIH